MNRSVRVFIGLETSPAVGAWVDVDPDADVTNDAVDAVRGRLGADRESGVMDTDDYPGRSSSLDEIQAVVTVADSSGVDVDAVVAYVEDSGTGATDPWDLQQEFDEAYQSVAESEEDFAREIADSHGTFSFLDEPLLFYIDWSAYARDLFMGDYWSAPCPTGGIYVFSSL